MYYIFVTKNAGGFIVDEDQKILKQELFGYDGGIKGTIEAPRE